MKLEAYSMGKLTNVTWGEDWGAKYFLALYVVTLALGS
jgi:hypothetical protein